MTAIRIGTQNLAAEAKSWQRKTFAGRLDDMLDCVEWARPDVWCVQESGGPSYLKKLDKEFKRAGLHRAAKGGRWRHIYRNPDTTTIHGSGLMKLNRLGTKHAAWAKIRAVGADLPLFITSAHLTEGQASTDAVRIDQAHRLLKESAKRNHNDYPAVHAGDFNSWNLVTKNVLTPAGYPDALDAAIRYGVALHSGYDTFNGRSSISVPKSQPMFGRHLDHIHVDKRIAADVTLWSTRPSAKASDHNPILVRLHV